MLGRRQVLPALAVVVVAGALAPASVAAPTDPPAYYWRWSDGSEQQNRTFRQSEYRVPERLPTLVVSAYPATRDQSVTWQYRQDGSWRTEDSGRTDRGGQVRLALNPYCPDGDWCSGTFDYRARAGAQTARFRITFAP